MILFRLLQFSLWSSGLALFAWAGLDSGFRDAEGFINGKFCLPVAAGTALVVLGCALTSQMKKFAFWAALMIVGQAVALQLIEAGPYVRYQHYKTFSQLLTATNPLLLLFLGAQTTFVVGGLRNFWRKIKSWLNRTFKTWQLLVAGLVFSLTSATLSRHVPTYVGELLFATFMQILNLANLILAVQAFPSEALQALRQRLDRLLGHGKLENDGRSGAIDRFALSAAVWATVVAASFCYFSYERHPHIPDEIVYLYHARYLAEGMLTMPVPPVPEAFKVGLMDSTSDKWYSPVPPGWPAMLALGVLFGAPWVVNPVLAGLNVLLAYILILELYDRHSARLTALLLCVSPWHEFMAMNLMTHTFTLTCALAAAVAIARMRRSGRIKWGWLGGFATGLVSLIRPLEGLVLAILLALWSLGVRGRRLRFSPVFTFMLGAGMVAALVLPYNKILTGDPKQFPIMVYTDKHYGPGSNALGFGPERGLGWTGLDPFPGHGLIDVLINANLNLFSMNIELFGWSTGSIFLMAFVFFSGRMRKNDYLMLVAVATIIGIHSFYWFSGGPDFGARYWYLTLVPCVVLTVRGVQLLVGQFEVDSQTATHDGTRAIVGLLSLCFLTLVNFFPWRAIDKYHHYRGMRSDIRHLAQAYDFGKSLVLIRGNWHTDYASAAVYNPIDLRADLPVYAMESTPEIRKQVLDAYPDRPVWVVDGPSLTHCGYKVVKGPLSRSGLGAQELETRLSTQER